MHEHPFACSDHRERDRRFVTDFIDVERYGPPFERFIDTARAILQP